MIRNVRIVLVAAILSGAFACTHEHATEPYDFVRDTPSWLQEKIAVMSGNSAKYYAFTTVYRYTWHSHYVYYISIPVSSCMYCELYDQHGNKIRLADNTILQDFLSTRTDEVIVWHLGPGLD